MMVYPETFVQRNQHRIYVREHPGEEPAIILMHGFPDNVHLYDRLFPTGRILLHGYTSPIRLSQRKTHSPARTASPTHPGVEINRIGFN